MLYITILRLAQGADKVFITTDLPDACYPHIEPLQLTFTTARGSAEKYCETHFPDVPIKEVL